MDYKFTLAALLAATLLSACSSKSNTPDTPYKVQSNNQLLPSYAKKTETWEVQNALLNRGLVLGEYNRVLPAEPSECKVKGLESRAIKDK